MAKVILVRHGESVWNSQRQYRTLLLSSADLRLDARDPRWTTQRAVGSPAFLRRYLRTRWRRRTVFVPPQIQALGD